MNLYLHIYYQILQLCTSNRKVYILIFFGNFEYNIYGSILPYVFFRGYEVTVNDAVARRVINLLVERKMSQYRLEQLSGIQHGHMQWILSGKSKTVTLSTVMRLAKGFDMSVTEFLDNKLFYDEELELE